MKSARVDFTKGINAIVDKALQGDGWMSFIDNADLRSGSPRPFAAPSFHKVANAGDKCLFVYRGHFYTSSSYRDYVATVVAGNEHVFWTESGQKPQKQVNGIQVDLGTNAPLIGPTITESDSLTPSFLTLSVNPSGTAKVPYYATTLAQALGIITGYTTINVGGAGNLKAGTVSYRVAAETANGIMPASCKATIGVTDGSSVLLQWGFVPGVIKWHIYGRSEDKESEITTVPAEQTYWLDMGDLQPSGSLASSYDQNDPVTYFYTYRRTVSGIINESAPSAITQRVQPSKARRVTRQVLSDGYFDQTGTITLTNGSGGVTLSMSSSAYSAITITAASLNSGLDQVEFTCSGAHGFSTFDTVLFSNFSDSLWNGQYYNIIKLSTTKFAVKNLPLPSDASYTTQSATKYACRLTITGATSAPIDKDACYLTISNADYAKKTGLYKASVTGGVIEFPFNVNGTVTLDSIKFINSNGYYSSWCLYRTGGGVADYQLVKEIDIWDGYFDDGVIPTKLGGPPDSYYEEGGITVIYDVPPVGMGGIEQHYAMLFGIDGHDVRWTPILRPDAWPTAFKFNFGFKPMKLASFGQALIVLCEDAIYRIDGNTPTGLSVSKTNAHDGCIAPHSVQKTTRGLIYLSRRGLMLFDGVNAVCITDTRIPSRFWSAPSRFKAGETPPPFWWFPTMKKREYMELAWPENIDPEVADAVRWYQDVPIDGLRDSIRSFYHLGRYFLYWAGGSGNDYEGNTCMYLDLEEMGYPIFSLGMKALDVCVDENQTPYALFGNDGDATVLSISSLTLMANRQVGGMDIGPDGFLYQASLTCIYRVNLSTGAKTVFAGDQTLSAQLDGTGTAARFSGLSDLSWNKDGNLYAVESDFSRITKITSSGVVTTIFTGGTGGAGIASHPTTGDLYVSGGSDIVAGTTGGCLYRVTTLGIAVKLSGNGTNDHIDASGLSAAFFSPYGLAFDSAGANLYIADSSNHCIRQFVVATGDVTTPIGTTTNVSGDTDATGNAVRFNSPSDITRQSDSVYYISDQNNSKIKSWTVSSGAVTTYYNMGDAVGDQPEALIYNSGNIYFARLDGNTGANTGVDQIVSSNTSTPYFADFAALYGAEATMSALPVILGGTSVSIYRLFAFNQNIPLHIRTGAMSFGRPHDRKGFRHIEFHGKGTLTVRVYVDGVLVTDTEVVINAETPTSERRMNLPRGSKGYTLDIELAGDANVRVVEIAWVPLPGVS